MRCRHCQQPIRYVYCSGRSVWVHNEGGFPCRDPECWLEMHTNAEPPKELDEPEPPRLHAGIVGGDRAVGRATVPR